VYVLSKLKLSVYFAKIAVMGLYNIFNIRRMTFCCNGDTAVGVCSIAVCFTHSKSYFERKKTSGLASCSLTSAART